MVQLMLAELGADDAQAAGIVGGAAAHLMFFGHIVKMEPLAALGRNNALGTQDRAVFAAIQRRKDRRNFFCCKAARCFHAPAGKDLVGVVVVVVVVEVEVPLFLEASSSAFLASSFAFSSAWNLV